MARGFNATLGSSTTDKVVSTLTTMPVQRSWFIVANRRANNAGGGFATMWRKQNGATTYEALFESNTEAVYRLDVFWNGAGNYGQWKFTRPALGADARILVTYDGGATTNDPVIYVDGVSQTLTEGLAPTGTRGTNTAEGYTIGNRASDNLRCWDGTLSEFAAWDRILTAGEAAALGAGFSPLMFPQSLVEYIPMLRDNVSAKLAAPTITGTAVQPHPRMYYPSGPLAQGKPTAAAAGSIIPRVMHHLRMQGAA